MDTFKLHTYCLSHRTGQSHLSPRCTSPVDRKEMICYCVFEEHLVWLVQGICEAWGLEKITKCGDISLQPTHFFQALDRLPWGPLGRWLPLLSLCLWYSAEIADKSQMGPEVNTTSVSTPRYLLVASKSMQNYFIWLPYLCLL